MRVSTNVSAALLGLAFAACSPPSAPESANDGAPAAALAADRMEPGQYRTTITMLDMNMPGVPAGMMEQMRGQPITTEYCIDESDVEDIAARDLNDPESGMSCTLVRANASGGRIDNEANCTGPMGEMNMRMTGTYSPTRVEMETQSTTTMQQGTMTQSSRIVTERIGDCPADAAPTAP